MLSHPTFLRRTLLLDAVMTGATGLLMVMGADLLEGLLGLPSALLRYAGLSLLPFVAVVGYLAMQDQPARPAVWA